MNVSKMKADRVNLAIAVLKTELGIQWPDGLDYCHDPAAGSLLLTDLVDHSSLDVSIWKGPHGYHVAPTMQATTDAHEAVKRREIHGNSEDSIWDAVARAWLTWRLEERAYQDFLSLPDT